MNTKLEQLQNILEENNIRPTYIRLRVLDYLDGNKNHPTADMIYEKLLKEIPTISKMSVYNTLNLFSEKGIVNQLVITGTETRFDGNPSSHHHFFCEKCSKVYDLGIECGECKYLEKNSIKGHKINEAHVSLKGICKNCIEQDKNRK